MRERVCVREREKDRVCVRGCVCVCVREGDKMERESGRVCV